MCFQFTHFLCDDWENIYILCLIIIIKSEVWTITRCLGLGHETMVCAVCLSIFLQDELLNFNGHCYESCGPKIWNRCVLSDNYIRLSWFHEGPVTLWAQSTVPVTIYSQLLAHSPNAVDEPANDKEPNGLTHYCDVIMIAEASQITDSPVVHNRLFRRISKKASKLCVTGLCAGNSPMTGEFLAQSASDAENVAIWWRHHPWTLFDYW